MRRHLPRHCPSWLLLVAVMACGGPQEPSGGAPEADGIRETRAAPEQGVEPAAVPTTGSIDPQVVTGLFAALRPGEGGGPAGPVLAEFSREDPSWPTVAYLLGEAHLRRREDGPARAAFRELATWAAANHPLGPYGDSWGGSGLAVIGLWRWLQILDEAGPADPGEVQSALEAANALQETRLYAGMLSGALLPALPLVEEAIAQHLAHVAWKNNRPEAPSLFLDFLAIDSQGKPDDEVDAAIRRKLFELGLATPARLELFRSQRLLGLVKTAAQKEEAAKILIGLWENEEVPPDVRAEAGYEWANFYRRSSDNRARVLEILSAVAATAADRELAEEALFRRGMVHDRKRGQRTTEEFFAETRAFRADMTELLRRFPAGRRADDALFQLANDRLLPDVPSSGLSGSREAFRPDVGGALEYFERLRGFEGRNDYLDSAYYLAALGRVGRGGEGDLAAADRLLEEYLEAYPEGVFKLRCLFWRGRIAESGADPELARRTFQQVIDEDPYDYYALRARMHLENGRQAIAQNLPAPSSQTHRELAAAFAGGRVDTELRGDTPYHVRLRSAVSSGLYGQLLAIDRGLAERLDDIPLARLDERGFIPAAALLLALRQDAELAKYSELTADNWLRLAGLLGHEVSDWPVAIEMVSKHGGGPRIDAIRLEEDPRYLPTVYPDPSKLEFLETPLADAAWKIDDSSGLSQSLMYAVVRHESRFYPGAISGAGAMGLFQFMPYVFRALDARGLTEGGSPACPDSGADGDAECALAYLIDPGRNLRLWARWVTGEFKLFSSDMFAKALMKHQGGSGYVARWEEYWEVLAPEGDLEYEIETARFSATRNFVRRALRDTAIVAAAGYFDDRPQPRREEDR